MIGREKTRVCSASLTVEASFAVPAVFFAIYAFLQLFLFLRIQADMQRAMNSVVRKLSEYGTVYSQLSSMSADEADDFIHKIGADTAIGRYTSQAYMGYLLREEIRDKRWLGWIRGGAAGVSTSGSSMFEKNGELCLVVSYRFAATGGLFSFGTVPVVQRVDARSLFGRNREVKAGDAQGDDEPDEEKVFVADRGRVYHCSATCTYLKLTIYQVSYADVGSERNKNGEKYRPCTYCDHTPVGDTVYITDYGNRYHTTISCSELKRSYRTMTISEATAQGLRACSKCGKTTAGNGDGSQ
ncbi:MAG: hypothetical protein IKX54_00365 [Lachnospiraceae bacterium]|nr:hypothetical protein [Lachnospiraceae bacterium]